MSFTSYAQNFEDVMLWRALGAVECGFYVDVGAHDPERDSVSKAFYDRGWRGINVEPVAQWHDKLQQQRPRDLNLRLAAGAEPGEITFYELPGTGLSTSDQATALRHEAEQGFSKIETTAQVQTLTSICERLHVAPIHFLKIDVEGAEDAVLRGIDFTRVRPWIVVVESTLPLLQTESHTQWEHLLDAGHYRFAYFDGLNRFYLASERADELMRHFKAPPNVFDDFELSGTASQPFGAAMLRRAEAAKSDTAEQAARADRAEASLAQARAQVTQVERRQAELEQQAVASAQRLEESERRAVAAEQRVGQLEQQSAADTQHAVELERQGAAARLRIEELEQQATTAKQRTKQLERQVADTRQRAEDLVRQVAGATRQTLELERHVLEQQKRADRAEQGATEARGREQLSVQSNDAEKQTAHRLRLEAAALEAERNALRQSWSWRLTAPLRWGGGWILPSARGASQSPNPAAPGTMNPLRHPLLASMGAVLRRPEFADSVNQRLMRYPVLHRRLVDIAKQQKLFPPEPAPEPAMAAVAVADTSSGSPDLSMVGPRAREIYAELKSAVELRRKALSP